MQPHMRLISSMASRSVTILQATSTVWPTGTACATQSRPAPDANDSSHNGPVAHPSARKCQHPCQQASGRTCRNALACIQRSCLIRRSQSAQYVPHSISGQADDHPPSSCARVASGTSCDGRARGKRDFRSWKDHAVSSVTGRASTDDMLVPRRQSFASRTARGRMHILLAPIFADVQPNFALIVPSISSCHDCQLEAQTLHHVLSASSLNGHEHAVFALLADRDSTASSNAESCRNKRLLLCSRWNHSRTTHIML